MDKLPPRPGHPVQGETTHESSAKTTVGSDGRRNVRHQGSKTNLHKPLQSNDVAKTALKDRVISKAPEVHGSQPNNPNNNVAVKNLAKALATLQHAIDECAKPGYRVSKSDALLRSIKTLQGINKRLGDTGGDLRLKEKLTNLLGTQIAKGRTNMTLSDFGRISKLANSVVDAPTRAQMEKKAVKLLICAQDLLNDSAYNYSPREYTAPFTLENAEKGAFIGDNDEQSNLAADPAMADGVMPALDSVDDSDVVIRDAHTTPIPTPPPPPPLPGEQAVDSYSADEHMAPDVMAALESVDDSDVVIRDTRTTAIPTPPPPPPLPGEQTVDSAIARPRSTEASKGYDAVIEELKQKLLEKGGPVEAADPSVVAAPGKNPVNKPASGKLSDLDRARKADASKGYDAVIAELKEKLLKRGAAVEADHPQSASTGVETQATVEASDVLSEGKSQASVMEQISGKQPDHATLKDIRAELINELKEVLSKRRDAVAPDDDSVQEPDELLPVAKGDKTVTEQSILPEQRAIADAQREARKNNYDAVIEELKNLQKLQKSSGAYHSKKDGNRQE